MNEQTIMANKEKLTNAEIMKTGRFRRAVLSGEYTRSISVFLRIKYPEIEDLSSLPRYEQENAKECVDLAFFVQKETVKELEEEMRLRRLFRAFLLPCKKRQSGIARRL